MGIAVACFDERSPILRSRNRAVNCFPEVDLRPHRLHKLFAPRSLALRCEHFDAAAAALMDGLREGGFDGELQLVTAPAQGLPLPATASFAELGRPPELALFLLPAAQLAKALREAAEQGVGAALLLTPPGGEGQAQPPTLAADLRDISRSYNMPLLGPASLGVIHPGAALHAVQVDARLRSGPVALLAQSSGFSCALLDWADSNGFGLSLFAAPGAALGVDFGELLDYLSLHPATRGILLYVEHIADARAFLSGLRAAARVKPVVVLKSGRHGGAAQRADAVFDTAIARAGAVRVNTVHQLFTAARALLAPRRPAGQRLAVISNAVGPARMAVDHAARREVQLAAPGAASLAALQELQPALHRHDAAVDLLGDAGPQRYAEAARILLADPGCDALLALLTPQRDTDPRACAEALIAVAGDSGKTLLACWMGERAVAPARALFAGAGISHYTSPERCVDAFAYLAAYERHQTVLLQAPPPQADQAPADLAGARLLIEGALSERRQRLTVSESKAVLATFHIPVEHSLNVHSAADALLAAETLGLPVKLHLNIGEELPGPPLACTVSTATQVRSAYRELLERMQRDHPGVALLGVGVQRLREEAPRSELRAAIERDGCFGPVLALGAAAAPATALALPPLNLYLAADLLRRALPERLRPPPDSAGEAALLQLLMRLSEMCCQLPELRWLRIDRLLSGADGLRVDEVALGVAPPPATTRRFGHMAIHPYPLELQRQWQLPDGRDVTIRPLRPEDAALERAFVENLSPESRYNRFMYRMERLTPAMLARFTQIDYDREMALAVVLDEHGRETRLLAVARYVTNPDGDSCEFALTVADDVQRQGIGRQLMQSLFEAARDRGLAVMEGDVLAANRRMLRLCEGLGFRLQRSRDDPEVVAVHRHLRGATRSSGDR